VPRYSQMSRSGSDSTCTQLIIHAPGTHTQIHALRECTFSLLEIPAPPYPAPPRGAVDGDKAVLGESVTRITPYSHIALHSGSNHGNQRPQPHPTPPPLPGSVRTQRRAGIGTHPRPLHFVSSPVLSRRNWSLTSVRILGGKTFGTTHKVKTFSDFFSIFCLCPRIVPKQRRLRVDIN
jgi:hypothetical protein